LLIFVTAVSILLAGLVTLPGMPALALLLAALVLGFHVLGNVLGTKLRSRADRDHSGPYAIRALDGWRNVSGAQPQPPPREVTARPWYGRGGDPLPWIPRITATAVFVGGCLGAVFLTLTVGHRTSAAGLAVGALSLAAICGWLAFLAMHFYVNVRRGFREALDGERKDQATTR
jgi:hypothetical protein